MELNQECVLLQNELRKFTQQVILEKVDELDKTCSFPSDNIKQLAEMGILGAMVPEDMGGAALDLMGLVVSLEEIGKVCTSTAIIIATHNVLFINPILKFGSDELKKKYLPPAATGEIIGGSANFTTNEITTEQQDENVLLNGKNPFVLNAEANGPFTMFLPTSEHKKEVSVFIVENPSPGVKISKNQNIIGLKAAGISEVIFKNYSVLSSTVIRKGHEGSAVLRETQDMARICFAAIALGIAQGATETAIKYAKERIQFNETIITFGMIREMIADMTTKIEAARLLTYNAAMKYDADKNYCRAAAIAKYFTGQAAVEITTSAIQILGGYGYMKDYPVERYFRDAQVINVLGDLPAEEKENIVRETIG
jgi:alkylation response protein AidB-like acyl-CoA dehydrogenase